MGGERTGTGKHVFCCLAVLICLSLPGCGSFDNAYDRSPVLRMLWPRDEAKEHLMYAQKLLAQGDYQAALEENQKVITLAHKSPPSDEALYNSGLIYAYPDNPDRDYDKSAAFLNRVVSEYPQSAWAESARVWARVIGENKELVRLTQAPAEMTQKDEGEQSKAEQHILQAKSLAARGKYDAALEENQKVLSLSNNSPPANEAMYNMGLIYADPGNPKRDYVKSIAIFKRLIKEYPQGTLTEQAKVWVQVLQDSENSKRVAAGLAQENEKLKHMIEESKKVDMEIEEKKREKTR